LNDKSDAGQWADRNPKACHRGCIRPASRRRGRIGNDAAQRDVQYARVATNPDPTCATYWLQGPATSTPRGCHSIQSSRGRDTHVSRAMAIVLMVCHAPLQSGGMRACTISYAPRGIVHRPVRRDRSGARAAGDDARCVCCHRHSVALGCDAHIEYVLGSRRGCQFRDLSTLRPRILFH
jgi:hypothetical protein